jgi:hypothetical protein
MQRIKFARMGWFILKLDSVHQKEQLDNKKMKMKKRVDHVVNTNGPKQEKIYQPWKTSMWVKS